MATMTKKWDVSTQELTKKWKEKDLGMFTVLRVESVNFNPHPFVIGTKHVVYASDHCGGMLGRDVLERIPCDHCHRPYDEHTYDVVLMIQLKRNATKDEVQAVLKPVCDEVEADGIDGFTFVENPEKYRIS